MTGPAPDSPSATARALPWLALALALGGAALATFGQLDGIAYAEGADEGTYLRYARRIATEGPGGFATLFERFVEDERLWIFPSPLRVAFVSVAALWTGAFGDSYRALSALSASSHLAFVALAFLGARRTLGPERASWLALSTATSPLLLALGRRALMDSFSALAGALALWVFVGAVRARGRVGPLAAFGAAFAFAILVKETHVLLGPVFVLGLAVARWREGPELRWPRFAVPLALAPALAGATWMLAAGGLDPVLRVTEIILASPATNDYAIRYGSGPWYRYVIDFVALSPWPTLGALVGLGVLAARGRERLDPTLAFFALSGLVLVAEHALFTKNVRYLALLELPLRLLFVHALWELVRWRHAASAFAVRGALVGLVAWMDLRTFEYVFVRSGVYDPVSQVLLQLRGIVPGQ